MLLTTKCHILVPLLFFIALISCEEKKQPEKFFSNAANTLVDDQSFAQMEFSEKVFDFGTVKDGDIVIHDFEFTNTGKIPLTITNASASCGCTVPNYPKEPIGPGNKGKITVQFNTAGKLGVQNKSIIIAANTLPNTTTLQLKGNVEEVPANQQK